MWPDDFGFPNGGPEYPPKQPPEHPEEELAAFALNALDGPEFQAVAQHVVQCFHCQEVLVGFQEMAARLASAAPETPLPPHLKTRVLSTATQPANAVRPLAVVPPPDPRWSMRRLRRWLAPTAIGVLSLMLAGAIGVIVADDREIDQLTAALQAVSADAAMTPSTAAATESIVNIAPAAVSARSVAGGNAAVGEPPGAQADLPKTVAPLSALPASSDAAGAAGTSDGTLSSSDPAVVAEAEQVDLVKQEMADVVEATMMAMQPDAEKLPMTSPMGTEPASKGVLIVDPTGQHAVLMVSGMPADSYQVWLVRADKQMLVGRIVVNDDDGNSVQSLEMVESVFDFQEVALLPDERHGPTTPNGEKFLTARIIGGPPLPPR